MVKNKIMKEFNFREYIKENPLTKETHLIKKSELKQIIKEEVTKTLSGIENMGKTAALEIKMGAIDEEIEKRQSQLSMLDENEGLSALMDKKKVREIQKEIKLLEKQKGKYQKLMEKESKRTANKPTWESKKEENNEEIVDEKLTDPVMRHGWEGDDQEEIKTELEPEEYLDEGRKKVKEGDEYYEGGEYYEEEDDIGIATPEGEWEEQAYQSEEDWLDWDDMQIDLSVGDSDDDWDDDELDPAGGYGLRSHV